MYNCLYIKLKEGKVGIEVFFFVIRLCRTYGEENFPGKARKGKMSLKDFFYTKQTEKFM